MVFFPGWSHGLGGGAHLAVVLPNECLWCRSLFSSVGAARQQMREAYEMGHCRDGRTRRRHVMKGDGSPCPLCGRELTGRTIENTRSTALSLNQHLHLCHSESQEKMPSVLPVSADTSMVPSDVLLGSRQAPALEAVARVQKGARSRSPRASARHRQLSRE